MQTFLCAHVLKPGWGQSSACHCHRIASFTHVSWFLPVVGNSKRTSRFGQTQHPVCSALLSNYSQRHREQSVQHLLQALCSLSDGLTSSCSTRHLNVFECPWHHLFTLASSRLLSFLFCLCVYSRWWVPVADGHFHDSFGLLYIPASIFLDILYWTCLRAGLWSIKLCLWAISPHLFWSPSFSNPTNHLKKVLFCILQEKENV